MILQVCPDFFACGDTLAALLLRFLVFFRGIRFFKETLSKLIPFLVRRPKEVPVVQAHYERNQLLPFVLDCMDARR